MADPQAPTITIYGAYWCPDCRRSKQFLGEHQIPYNWVDIEQDPASEQHVLAVNGGKRIIPTIEFEDGSVLVEPSKARTSRNSCGCRPSASASRCCRRKTSPGSTATTTTTASTPLTAANTRRALCCSRPAAAICAWVSPAKTTSLDNWGFVVTGHDLAHADPDLRGAAALETSVPGIFAAGDLRAGSTKQVASAAGEGAAAALLVREHLRRV